MVGSFSWNLPPFQQRYSRASSGVKTRDVVVLLMLKTSIPCRKSVSNVAAVTVRIHRCGALDPVTPPICQTCKTSRFVSLDTREGERFSGFLWTCTKCKNRLTYFSGPCRNCKWPVTQGASPKIRNSDVEVHRAGRTFYAQTTVLLNIPNRQLDGLFAKPEWPLIVAAKYLQFPEAHQISLLDFSRTQYETGKSSGGGLTNVELDELLRKQSFGLCGAFYSIHDEQGTLKCFRF
jgi:hypothetical protein